MTDDGDSNIKPDDQWQLFVWFGHGPGRQAPNFVREWAAEHASHKVGAARSAEAVGKWLQEQLDKRRDSLTEATYARYSEYVGQQVEALASGTDCMCWVIWARNERECLQIAVVRERPHAGSPHHSAADRAALR